MFDTFKKLQYAARVVLARKGGEPETIDVAGKPTVVLHGGEGEPFVYLHSTLDESFLWFPFYQAWAKQFRVLVPTHPGFGRSGGFDQIDTIEDMAFHYIELLDTLGLEQVCLGGVSLGGWIAAEVAVRWPERVKKLWICNAPGLWTDEDSLGDLFRVMQDRDAVRKMLFHDPNSWIAREVVQDNPDEERLLRAYQSMTVLARLMWERPYDPKLGPRLHRVQCPTLLLWGEFDRLVPPAFGRAYQKHLPHAEFKLIPGCGHLPFFEKEAEFVEAVASFCKSI
ncbi:MAG TPA: alpha/beta hydrolase [Gemmataceae bacterium]|nr:alpha/beta hydrolase [Gemmataceae bacterium]